MNYNLLDEKWIPVLYKNGSWDCIGIRQALKEAHIIRQIAASNPMDRVAIFRFLLALLYWCRGSPQENTRGRFDEPFPEDWFVRLDENRDCFNLFGDGKRFYQDRSARRNRPATDLIQEIPTGNNFWHFRHSIDEKDGLCPACCALGLLRLPLFSVSGRPDLKSGINGSPPVYVVPWGPSLADTVKANWTPQGELGVPAWVKPDIRPPEDDEVPLLTGLTVLARRVWLHDPETPGTCVNCGTKTTTLVRTCEFQSAGEETNDRWNDPHVVYLDRTPRKALRAPDLTAAGRFKMDRPWTVLMERIVESGKFVSEKTPRSLLVVGFATDQAKNIDVWERTIRLPSRESIQRNSSMIELWDKQGWLIGKRMERICRSKVAGAAASAAIRPHIEHEVSADVSALLTGDEEAWQQAAEEYGTLVGKMPRSLAPGFSTAAVKLQKDVAYTVPDMRPKTEETKKPVRKKGGEK